MQGRGGWIWIAVGACLSAVAVALGAVGAHVMAAADTPELLQRAEWMATGQRYQVGQALGLIVAGLVMLRQPGTFATLAAWGLALGILCFSGGLYVQALAGVSVGLVVPLGGSLMILGWLLLALQAGLACRRAAGSCKPAPPGRS
ncbi:MAG: hypothetical protein Kilf2KO_25620 [Rhodospirillales bacterium]